MSHAMKWIAAAAIGLATISAPALAKDKETGEEELAKLLEGREAGEPTSCIRDNLRGNRIRIIDETALVYGRGRTIYVNRTRHPERIDDDEIIVTRRFGSTLCKLDIVTTVDRFNGFFSGNIFLTDFVPYTRVDKEDDEAADS